MRRTVLGFLIVGVMVAIGTYALAHQEGRHVVDPNSPSDVMMEQCTAMGLGPEGHTIVGRMIDQMHGEGAHHRMHEIMDQMLGHGAMGGGMSDITPGGI